MWKTVQRFLKEAKAEPPYDPAVPFLDILKKKKKKHAPKHKYKNIHALQCSVLFTTAETRKQPKCSPRDG